LCRACIERGANLPNSSTNCLAISGSLKRHERSLALVVVPAAAAADELRQLDGVAAVVPVYSRRVAFPTGGRDLGMHVMSFAVPASVPISPEDRSRFFPVEGSLIVDRVFADDAGLSVGDQIELLDRALTSEQIAPGGNPIFALAFVNGSTASELLGLHGYVNFFVLRLEPSATVEQVAPTVEAALPGTETRTAADYAATMATTVDEGFLPVVERWSRSGWRSAVQWWRSRPTRPRSRRFATSP
jgi:hypothetical protein